MEAEPLAGRAALDDRFEALTRLLREHRQVWESRPFVDPAVP